MVKVHLTKEDYEACREQGNPNACIDQLLRKFKKRVNESGILDECRRREYFLKKSLARKEKSKRARIRQARANKGRKRPK